MLINGHDRDQQFFFGMLTTGAFDENVAPKKNTREYKFKLTETFCIIKVSQNIINLGHFAI